MPANLALIGRGILWWPHLGLPDPSDAEGTHEEKLAAFQETYDLLMMMMQALFDLPIADLVAAELKSRLVQIGNQIGKMDGATDMALNME